MGVRWRCRVMKGVQCEGGCTWGLLVAVVPCTGRASEVKSTLPTSSLLATLNTLPVEAWISAVTAVMAVPRSRLTWCMVFGTSAMPLCSI